MFRSLGRRFFLVYPLQTEASDGYVGIAEDFFFVELSVEASKLMGALCT